jgi:hypothetical protein
MTLAVEFYTCFTDVEFNLVVRYRQSVQTAHASYTGNFSDGNFFIEFGADQRYMTQLVAIHELSHCAGIGVAPGWPQLFHGQQYQGAEGNAELRAIYSVLQTQAGDGGDGDTEVSSGTTLWTPDGLHFSPFGLLELRDADDLTNLIAHCRLVMVIRRDLKRDRVP